MINKSLTTQIEATHKSWKRFEENREKEWGLHGHDMGIHQLNLMLGGWIPGKLTTIGARSGIGKTALTAPMFQAGARVNNGRRAEFLVFSWEMEASYLVDRHICMETGLNLKMLNQGAKLLGPKSLGKVKSAYSDAKKLPVTYQQHSTDINTVRKLSNEFVGECLEKSEVEGIYVQPVIVIDYIGMAQFEGSGLRTYGIGDFMNGLKQLANSTGAAILVLAQINRGADEKGIPERSDFSDSQSIEMASDNLVLLHRPEYNNIPVIYNPATGEEIDSKHKMLIRVLKGRDYGIGDSVINCDIKYFRFWSLDHSYDAKYWELYGKREFWLDHFKLGSIEQSPQLKVV